MNINLIIMEHFIIQAQKAKKKKYKNPYNKKMISFFSSGYNYLDISSNDDYNRQVLFYLIKFIDFITKNEIYSYFGVDFGKDRYLLPSCYTIGKLLIKNR